MHHSKPRPEELATNLRVSEEAASRDLEAMQKKVTTGIDDLIEILKVDRDKIGAYAIILKAKPGECLVDPETGNTSRGITVVGAADKDGLMLIQCHAEDLAEEIRTSRRYPMAGILR